MSRIEMNYKEYQAKYTNFIVIKDFYKIGSAVMGYSQERDEEFRNILSRCLLISKSPLQVVRLGGNKALETYGEYAPYVIFDDSQDLLDICISGNCPGERNPFIKEVEKACEE